MKAVFYYLILCPVLKILSHCRLPFQKVGTHFSKPFFLFISPDSYVIDAIPVSAGGYIFSNDLTPELLLQSIHRVSEKIMQLKT